MGVNSLPKTVTRQRRDCDLNPGLSAPESRTLTTRLASQPTCQSMFAFTEEFITLQIREITCYLKMTSLCEHPSSTKLEVYQSGKYRVTLQETLPGA